MGPSSERSAQSTLPLQILSGVRQTEVSLAQGYLGGLQTAVSQDSSSERSSQSMSPSHTQLLVMHLPVESRASEWHQKRFYFKRRKGSPAHGYTMLHLSCMDFSGNILNVEMKWTESTVTADKAVGKKSPAAYLKCLFNYRRGPNIDIKTRGFIREWVSQKHL